MTRSRLSLPSPAQRLRVLALAPLMVVVAACSSAKSGSSNGSGGKAGVGGTGGAGAGGSTGSATGGGTSSGGVGVGAGGSTFANTGGTTTAGGGGAGGPGGVTTGSGGVGTGLGGGAAGGIAGTGQGGGGGDAGASGGTIGTGGTPMSGTAGRAGSAGAGGGGGSAIGVGGGSAGAPVACQPPLSIAGGTAVTVSVNLAMVRSTVPSHFLGIATAAYDGNMTLPTTPAFLRDVGVKLLRFPGGSYGDIYHWSTHTASPTVANSDPALNGTSVQPYLAPETHFANFVSVIQAVGANALITVNYGSNPASNGPGLPEEAAAWVAYANAMPTNTTVIGTAGGVDWQTAGYWATLRGSAKLPVDDGKNFLRISHPAPIGIRYWEVGNELYGNGYYYGNEGWEEDLHLAHDGTPRRGHVNLSPAAYGRQFRDFATKMKAVDPTAQVGAVLHWPYNEYADWNDAVLPQTCELMDFGVNHWYAGQGSLTDVISRGRRDVPMMFSDLRNRLTTHCGTRAPNIQLAVTEWGVNTYTLPANALMATHLIGLFSADAHAHFMEQSALTVTWQELHDEGYLGRGTVETPAWGYKGMLMASTLARGGDTMVQATVQTPPAALANGLLQAHASRHADGGVAVMLVNTSPTAVATATVNVTGFAAAARLPCVGTRYAYLPGPANVDGMITRQPIFSTNDAMNRVTVSVPAYSVIVIVF